MSVILRNEYGAVAVNKGVIEKMIVEDLLEMFDYVLLCTKKGKMIKKKKAARVDPARIDPDYYDAIEVYEKRQEVRVKVFVLSVFGNSISNIADQIFAKIENDFDLLRLGKPGVISVNFKGIIMPNQVIKRSIEVVRKNV